ncbi:MerR family transcriptional regulator [Shewanella sp. VB17]|uniref:MerR family transcriptional regulator n=1 Tax=Shewanella sp. VB17 TaxID=2739432 RepID=UPI0015676597|nr:MerR family transcriptional regulator [Shewanella sp. VB17]NRD72920.1 MerR family transcriptional regulator [Shewanella sp. VB17]
MLDNKIYSVSKLSAITGVTIRTLHYYDKVNLLKPHRRIDNHYREYTQKHLALLKQIIIYRELDFSLTQIKDLIYSNEFSFVQALSDQKKLLLKRQEETQLIINSIEVTMNVLAGEKNLELLFSDMPLSFNDKLITLKEDEDSYNSMLSSLGELSELEIESSKKQTDEWAFNYKLTLLIPIDSDEVQEQVNKHYFLMNSLFKKLHGDSFKGIGYEGYLILAEQTISNPVTKAVYDNYQSGMAEHLYEAMIIFADKELKGNIEQYRQVTI